jgi:nicotinamidase/pyrazinamidase
MRLGYTVVIVEDACRGIGIPLPDGRTTMDEARDRLTGLGVRFIDSESLSA